MAFWEGGAGCSIRSRTRRDLAARDTEEHRARDHGDRRARDRRARDRRARGRRARNRRACNRRALVALFASCAQAQYSSAMDGGSMGGGFLSLGGWEGEKGGNDDVATSAVVAAHVATLLEWRRRAMAARRVQRPRYRGSTPGRAANRPRNFELGLHSILRDYFGVDGLPPVYGLREFERRFRVPMSVFLRIYHAIKDRPFWVQSVNATGRPQAHPLQKLVAAFRVLGYGESCDRADEYVRLSSSTISRAVTLFTEFIVDEFSPRYLRPPTTAEIGNILARNAERGLPGCLGSLDCSHWQWSACPKGRAGTYQGRDGQRSIVIEAICDEDTWIYHIFSGCPGSLNDINVLYQSPLYMDVITGKWPPRDCPFTVNGNTRTLLYYLVDGIYPRFAFFVAPYPNPQTREQRTFNRLQEALYKDVERLFKMLTARFRIMLHPCRYRSVPRMVLTTQTVAMLHNMVVECRRNRFFSRSRSSVYGKGSGGELGEGAAGAAQADGADGEGGGADAGAAAVDWPDRHWRDDIGRRSLGPRDPDLQ